MSTSEDDESCRPEHIQWYGNPEYRRYWQLYRKAKQMCDIHLEAVGSQQRSSYLSYLNNWHAYQRHCWAMYGSQHQQVAALGYYGQRRAPLQAAGTRLPGFSPYVVKPQNRKPAERGSTAAAQIPRNKSKAPPSKRSEPSTNQPACAAQDEFEMEMEVTEEMLEFFATSARHKEEQAAKKKGDGDGAEDTYVDLGDVWNLKAGATQNAPTEKPGQRRTAQMKLLYGSGAAMIHGMETAMQLNFDRNCDIQTPKLWPQLPVNIKF